MSFQNFERLAEHIARADVQMETDKTPSGHPGINGKSRAAIGGGVEVERRFSDYKDETVAQVNVRSLGQQFSHPNRIPVFRVLRLLSQREIDVARCASRLNAKLHSVTAF